MTVTGVRCENRLEAMQRVLEHEIIHLAELLVWQDSKCTKSRFQDIARRLFGHQEHTHNLVTTREIASQVHGIRRGSAVEFEFEGIRYRGVVANITKELQYSYQATVACFTATADDTSSFTSRFPV